MLFSKDVWRSRWWGRSCWPSGVPGARSYARQDPQGRDYFWLTGAFQNAEPDAEDTDEWALAHRYVSVVPVQVDMTDYRMLAKLRGVINE